MPHNQARALLDECAQHELLLSILTSALSMNYRSLSVRLALYVTDLPVGDTLGVVEDPVDR
jgi:hypothetical protein